MSHLSAPCLPELMKYECYSDDQLLAELQRESVTGMHLQHYIDLIPCTILPRTGKAIARVMANLINPQQRGICTEYRKRIAQRAGAAVATIDRFTRSSIGRTLFTTHRPEDTGRYDASRRVMTRQFMLYALALRAFTKNARKRLRQLEDFALRAASVLLCAENEGDHNAPAERDHSEPQNQIKNPSQNKEKINIPLQGEPAKGDPVGEENHQRTAAEWDAWQKQNEIRGKNLAAEREYLERQQRDTSKINQLGALLRQAIGRKAPQRDVNAISTPESNTPAGFRGADTPDEPTQPAAPRPVMLSPVEKAQIYNIFQCRADWMPADLAARARAAGVQLVQ